MGLVNIWVTRICNLKCRYCYENSKPNSVFKKEYVEPLIRFIKNNKWKESLMINFHGGEPLLNFEVIKEIVEALKREEVIASYSFTTNMLLMTEEIAQYVLDNDINISVSIDGTEKINDYNRVDGLGQGTYQKVVEKIKILKEKNVAFRTRMTIVPETVGSLLESVKCLHNIGCANIVAAPDLFDKTWSEAEIQKLEEQLQLVRLFVQENSKTEFLFHSEEIRKVGKCHGGIKEFNVDSDGSIYPCTYVVGQKEYLIGSIFEGINKEKVNKFREMYEQENRDCQGCNYSKFCMASRCKFLNKIIEGDYHKAPGIVCAIENMMFRMNN